MRVAILTRDYPPSVGGIATHVEGLVKALKKKGVEVGLYVGGTDVGTLLLPFDIPLQSYDVVHVQSLPYGAFVFGVPLVVTVHSPVLEEFPHYRSSLKFVSLPAIALEMATLGKAKEVLAVSDQSRLDLEGGYGLRPGRVAVIGNGVDCDRFSASHGTAARDPKSVIVVSRLEPRKNVQEAIKAIAQLPEGSCALEVVGDGSERTALEELAQQIAPGRVSFRGRVSEASLPEQYGASGIFLTTSRSEGFGLSLLEAMASGCACLVSDIPTHRALVEHGVSGMVFRSQQELLAELKELLSDPEKERRLGEAAMEVARGHTWEKVAERVAAAYDRAILG